MRRYFLVLLSVFMVGIVSQSVIADDGSSLPTNYFNQDAGDKSTGDFSIDDPNETPSNKKIAIPRDTPTPLEGVRWQKKTIWIYMRTSDPRLKSAFQNAVKNWNKVKEIKIKWTKDEDKANIIAADGDLSANNTNNGVGYQTAQLGETKTEYNPDTHELHKATSILDPYQLDYTNPNFRSEVAQHELGHALGLAHAPEYEHSVMVPRNIRTGITKNDRKSIHLLYQ
ncbi:M57 family metalloprotease [Limosilactobacillus fastidiosus]|uniref:Matrixin family metalloprotease n=1 Tax=Limosilactobacillus fastidiosus TaxID=2759855 RepID=A0A7W3TZ05_9LACO|nr:M57 family metalloprotease [Limosilactobacillus fastidiosus]MBB1063408.1 matrixin family metalloprotease [Limosilactobacillus fastidiosus]MBB1085911.1 matrixin family metalloprotease [Limosilactobacillus fastidiosus]MCD7084676.1 M57 family metalloprotease [Limosilactobacillus fastidiosus]MCD7085752.1 M57 family metalloprotease [Limosilactobacillus fastidiosus]MCD7113829.1 M57 family metalloprotease [Limosilactobacillus fastidiosus]